ncbi:MAG TPA: NAD(P)/FAD-dependent oxidoreductase [Microvirga sp.]|jgi:cation diffusion facilitator CzcD-associated flavoprotein CzcO|nr:NAD(P)/FAD-dependent oxidoreductase [Microvirga sp.]
MDNFHAAPALPPAVPAQDHVDVLIVGAGLSGIAAAHALKTRSPARTFAILEARDAIGGTWDLFRYPGVRSDSDMYTLGYSFRPWPSGQAFTDGPSILRYIRDAAREHGIEGAVRFGHRATRASWSSAEARWTVEAETAGGVVRLTCGFLFLCTGYYDYEAGHGPEWPGMDRFAGRIVHPQHWPEDLDHTGRRVVVIGSGATAVTLVPELARRAAHVAMLQRSPTYIVALPSRDAIADRLHRHLPQRLAHGLVRWKNVLMTSAVYALARLAPGFTRRGILRGARRELGPDVDVATHFTPRYDPWDQRLCVAPDGDFFQALRAGTASVITDEIETFTPSGLRLRSGSTLEADLIVTATGLKLKLAGGMRLDVDGAPVDLAKALLYKGMMLSDVPNAACAIGYTNASWTLKCELTALYVCRLLNHMAAHGFDWCVPRRPVGPIAEEPAIGLTSGYIRRAAALLPKQGTRPPWRLHQNYARDLAALKFGRLADGVMAFGRATRR